MISARSTFEPRGVQSPAGWKTFAFKEVINAFYSRYPNQRWKNVLAIGDGRADREALHRVTEERLAEGCRQKNVKFLVKPSLDTLKKQLMLLTDVLEHLIMTDDHIDIRITEDQLGYNRALHYPKDTTLTAEEQIIAVFNATIVDSNNGHNNGDGVNAPIVSPDGTQIVTEAGVLIEKKEQQVA